VLSSGPLSFRGSKDQLPLAHSTYVLSSGPTDQLGSKDQLLELQERNSAF
jgi:hypothetical protein